MVRVSFHPHIQLPNCLPCDPSILLFVNVTALYLTAPLTEIVLLQEGIEGIEGSAVERQL